MKKIFLILTLCFATASSAKADSASLSLVPSEGTFLVGSTFSISIYVDTKGSKINVVEADLKFPPEVLQVTNSTAGSSFISEWLVPPSYSNTGGTISFKGGIPGGIETSAGLFSTITFRARAPGKAQIKFLDSTKVLLHDGKGTPVLAHVNYGNYTILVPPHEGPEIVSLSHPDSDIWYSNSSPVFSWEKEEGVTDFSFSFSQNSQENPDTVSEGIVISKSYDNVADGVWYFHIRAKENGVWGKTSHLAVKIDTTPPQKFEPKIELNPAFVYFETKDSHSGIDHYEISVLDFQKAPASAPFFIEANSPYKIPFAETGRYSLFIRAYDKAGNYQEEKREFRLISSAISYIEGKGFQVKNVFLPLYLIYIFLFLFLAIIFFLTFYFIFLRKTGLKKGMKEITEALTEIKKIEEKETEIQVQKEKFKTEKEKLERELGGREKKTEEELYSEDKKNNDLYGKT